MAKKKDVDQIKDASQVILDYITRIGWASVPDLISFAGEQDIPGELLHKVLRVLDRQRLITARPGSDGKTPGWESLLGRSVGTKRYGALSAPLDCTMTLLTPALGQLSEDDTNFSLARDIDGNVAFTPGQARAMLKKAYRLAGLGADPELSESAVKRIAIVFLGAEPKGPSVSVKRRPVNREKKAVGVLVHEALPSGSTIKWRIAFPATHFSPEAITALLASAENVGFSPAGSGESGGNHGLFKWSVAKAAE
jgi:hypothetical protein